MKRVFIVLAGAVLPTLASCGGGEDAGSLDAKANQMDRAADQATDQAQADVLENQAEALREAAEGQEQADTNGSVTVIKE